MTTPDGAPDEDVANDDPADDHAPMTWHADSSDADAPADAAADAAADAPADADADDSTDDSTDDSADAPPDATEKAPSHRRSWRQRIADALGPNDVEETPAADDVIAELDGDPEPSERKSPDPSLDEEAPAASAAAPPLVWEDEVSDVEAHDDDDELRVREGEDSVGDYGVDIPGAVRGFSWAAGATFGLTLVFAIANSLWMMSILFLITVALTFESLTLIWSSRVAKLRERVRAIDALELEGDERVLDVSCGRGLLLIEAASRLDGGEAIGIDVWGDDENESSPDFALDNAEIEGVDDRVLVETADARALPFEDGAFDAVISGMVSRNIPDADGRAEVLAEVDRVLAPGGRLVILDVAETEVYVEALRGRDWTDVTRSRLVFRMFPPIRYVIGTKPGGEPPPVEEASDLETPVAEPDASELEADAGGDEALVEAGSDETAVADAESAPAVEPAGNS